MPRHIIELLNEVRPKRALFTTFTFNLPFFEAAVLPAASRGDGCEVSVLVDARQLAGSTTGVFSRDAGIRYALAAVQAPGGGFFHPKIAFLETDDDQYLCVGSGNLTISGLSRQLESWDITRCSEDPGVITEFASFLTTLATATEVSSKRASAILKKTASRVSSLGTPNLLNKNMPGTRLLHSMVEPVSSQLTEIFREKESIAIQVTVLSPFHSDGGGPIRRLAEEVRAEKIRIGHDGTARFEKAWYAPVLGPRGFVVAQPEKSRGSEGRLHAKVFELQGATNTLVMTGSVNATARSLESTRNVEVAIVRWGITSPFKWKTVDPELFLAADMPDMDGDFLFVEASLEDGVRVAGALCSSVASNLLGDISWNLMEAEMLREYGAVAVSSDGLFQIQLSEAVPQGHLALKLEIRAGDLTAQAWINDERALHATARGARRNKSFEGALQGVATLQDLSYIEGLLWKASQTKSAHTPAVHAAQGGVTKTVVPEIDKPFSYDAWLHSGNRDRQLARGGGRTDLYTAVFFLIFPKVIEDETLEGSKENIAAPRKIVLGETDDSESTKEEKKEPAKAKKKNPPHQSSHVDALANVLLRASIEIHRAFNEERSEMDDPETLALVASAHELAKLQGRWLEWNTKGSPTSFPDWDYQRSFVLWLEALSRYPWDDDSRKSLMPVVTCLCCLAAYCLVLPGTTARFAKLATLRTLLDRMAARQLPAEEVLRLAETGLSDEIFSRLRPEVRALVSLCAPHLGGSVRLDVELLAEVTDAIKVDATPKKSHPTFPLLYSALRKNSRLSRAVDVISKRGLREGGCPICGQNLNDDEREQLRFSRVLRHPGNPRSTNTHLIIYPDDADVFKKALSELLK